MDWKRCLELELACTHQCTSTACRIGWISSHGGCGPSEARQLDRLPFEDTCLTKVIWSPSNLEKHLRMNSFLIIIFIFILYLVLFENQSYREREKREQDYPSSSCQVTPPRGHSGQNWVSAKQGNGNLSGFLNGSRVGLPLLPSQPVSRKLDWEGSSHEAKQLL